MISMSKARIANRRGSATLTSSYCQPKATILHLAIHSAVCYFNIQSVAILYTTKGIGSKSMRANTELIGRLSESISSKIFPKNFPSNLRKGWKPDNVTRAACFHFQLEPSYLPKVTEFENEVFYEQL
jgi:hypothetical protein